METYIPPPLRQQAQRQAKPAQRCRKPGYKPSYADRPLSGRGYVLAAADVAAVLVPLIDKLNAELTGLLPNLNEGGGKTIVAERAAACLRVTDESMQRRLYSVLNGKNRTLTASIGEALLDAFDLTSNDVDIPTLPCGIREAQEMVEVWHELREEAISDTELMRDAKRLLEVTRTYVHGADRIDEGICLGLETLFDQAEPEEAAA